MGDHSLQGQSGGHEKPEAKDGDRDAELAFLHKYGLTMLCSWQSDDHSSKDHPAGKTTADAGHVSLHGVDKDSSPRVLKDKDSSPRVLKDKDSSPRVLKDKDSSPHQPKPKPRWTTPGSADKPGDRRGSSSSGLSESPSPVSGSKSVVTAAEIHAGHPTRSSSGKQSPDSGQSSHKVIYTKAGQTRPTARSTAANDTSLKNGEREPGATTLELPPRQPLGGGTGTARHKVTKSGNQVSSIPEEEIRIPNDGNLASFSADAMATFLRSLRLEDRLINHLHRNGLDGRRFGRLKDSDLDNLQLNNNPVLLYFRDKTAPAVAKKPSKQRLPFVL